MTHKTTIDHYILRVGTGKHISRGHHKKIYFKLEASNGAFRLGFSEVESLELLAYVTCKFVHRDNSSKADTVKIQRLEDNVYTYNYDALSNHDLGELVFSLDKMQKKYNYCMKFDHSDYKR